MTARYFSITNSGDRPDHPVSATSSLSDDVSMYMSAVMDGAATKRQVAEVIDIPARETLDFEPGGLHPMPLKPMSRPKDGETIPVTFTFEKAAVLSECRNERNTFRRSLMPHAFLPALRTICGFCLQARNTELGAKCCQVCG